MLRSTILRLEAINEWVGRVFSWLTLGMVVMTFVVAVLRYVFNIGFVWMQESYVWMHAAVFMICSGYTLLYDGHVRIDLVYGAMTRRKKAWVNLLGAMFLLFPVLVLIWWTSFPYVVLSWSRWETSPDVGGLHGLYLLKSVILGFVMLVGLQGVALVLRSLMVLRGETPPPVPGDS